ncbi:hypothetical protein [Sphingobacterium sp.]|uniref:hypothetical protein n=1 Tax=Sphingobacterium sp. TaxID=341027 RepID=UPI00258E4320|nr:hypothetical protein [Sphingobacterium sp.]WET68657.1 MAG: hypothetical protein P0Y57_22750 [Sphingobacterium sp.]
MRGWSFIGQWLQKYKVRGQAVWSRFVLASYLLRTLFGCDTDIVQVLYSYRTDPEQELTGRNLVNNDHQIVELRRWSEHSTNTTRIHWRSR